MIIPCLNEEKTVSQLLQMLTEQTTQDFEVIIVDSQSEDDTAAAARMFANQLQLQIIETGRGVSKARNSGAAHANSGRLVFLDADVYIPAGFVENACHEMQQRGLGLATPEYRPQSAHLIDRFGTRLNIWYQKLAAALGKPKVMGFCVFCSKSIHDMIGGFDEAMKFGEDYDYSQRAAEAGARFGFLQTTYFKISLRRFDEEGRLKLTAQNISYEFYRHFKPEIFREDTYQFGQHRTPEQSKSSRPKHRS